MVSIHTGEHDRGLQEARASLKEATAIGDAPTVGLASVCIGFMLLLEDRLDEAGAALEHGVKVAADAGDEFMEAFCTAVLGMQQGASGNLEEGIRTIERAREVQKRLHDYEGGGVALSGLAQLTFAGGNPEEALEIYEEALRSFETVGDRPEVARVLGEMGWTTLALARGDEARHWFMRSLQTYEEAGSPRGMGLALQGLAATEAQEGHNRRAVLVAGAADAMAEQVGVVIEHPMGPGAGDRIDEVRGELSEQDLRSLSARGRSMSSAEVLILLASEEPLPELLAG